MGIGSKDRVQSFSMQIVLNKRILLKPEKKLAQIRFVDFKKRKNR